jgi:nucleotide-binding universal stress UspA family protein
MTATSAAVIRNPLPKIETVLFPTDFSPCSRAALPYACVLAEQNKAKLHLLNVVNAPLPPGESGVSYVEPAFEDELARRNLAKLTELPAVKCLPYETSVEHGPVYDSVCRFVREKKGDIVVMGTHGRQGVRQFVLGSVAEQVFRRSECPVLSIGPGASKNGPTNGRFGTILVALDLSPDSLRLAEWAHLFAVANQSRLIFFHAIRENVEVTAAYPNYLEDAVASARRTISELLPTDVPWTDIAIKLGIPTDKILETAIDRNVDLIIIGARRGATLAAHSPWACAHEIVCAAHCPVLTIRH